VKNVNFHKNDVNVSRYYELKEQDMLKFGFSTREYIMLHEKTDTTEVHKSESEDSSSSDSDSD